MLPTDTLKAIADAIRTKTGKTGAIYVSDMPQEILDIPTGGETYISDITASESNTLDCASLDNGIYRFELKVEPNPAYTNAHLYLLKYNSIVSALMINKSGIARATYNNSTPTISGSGTTALSNNTYAVYKISDLM